MLFLYFIALARVSCGYFRDNALKSKIVILVIIMPTPRSLSVALCVLSLSQLQVARAVAAQGALCFVPGVSQAVLFLETKSLLQCKNKWQNAHVATLIICFLATWSVILDGANLNSMTVLCAIDFHGLTLGKALIRYPNTTLLCGSAFS